MALKAFINVDAINPSLYKGRDLQLILFTTMSSTFCVLVLAQDIL